MRAEKKEDVAPAIEAAIAAQRPAVIDFKISREENVYPMVPAGKEITEMIGGHPKGGRKS